MFAGIGGICLAFRDAGAEMVWANELDHLACETYRKNFGSEYLVEGDVRGIDPSSVPDMDVLTAGFPCQAFSVAGYRKGFGDDRGALFFEVVRMIGAKSPRAVLLENVKNLVGHDEGRTFESVLQCLRGRGYSVAHAVLNSKDCGGVPQNRERVYIAAFRDPADMEGFAFPPPVPLEIGIRDVADPSVRGDPSLYYTEKSPIYAALDAAMGSPDSVYQWRRTYVRENKSGVCPTLTANMGGGGHNVPLIRDRFGIRKLSPEECLGFQGFPPGFAFAEMSASHKYRQAGNSVSVPVVRRIAENMILAMRRADGRRPLS
jgi:DNA (cytosine-5)-methyltransferase 1